MGERCLNIALRFLLLTLKPYSSYSWRYNNPMSPCFIFALPSHSLHTFLCLNGRMPYPKPPSPNLTSYFTFRCRLFSMVSTLSYHGADYLCRVPLLICHHPRLDWRVLMVSVPVSRISTLSVLTCLVTKISEA